MRGSTCLAMLAALTLTGCGDEDGSPSSSAPPPRPDNCYEVLIGSTMPSKFGGTVDYPWSGIIDGTPVSGLGEVSYYFPLDHPLPLCATLMEYDGWPTLVIYKVTDGERVDNCTKDVVDGEWVACYPTVCLDAAP